MVLGAIWFQEQRLSLSHSQKEPESEIRKKIIRILDSVGKNHRIPDPQHWDSLVLVLVPVCTI
jgi:hypothetical protein